MAHYDIECRKCNQTVFSAATGKFYDCACKKIKRKELASKIKRPKRKELARKVEELESRLEELEALAEELNQDTIVSLRNRVIRLEGMGKNP